MITLAAAFLTFVGFLFAGLLALVITAALDKQIGKEKALLLWSGVLLLFTLWQCTPEPVSVRARVDTDAKVPSPDVLEAQGDPFHRPDLPAHLDRNPFQKHSDTRGLDPIALEEPPWLPLELQLPPTIPGPAPGARYLLQGTLPQMQPGDGSTIPDIAAPEFHDYQPVVDDVYDSAITTGGKQYVYIRKIRQGGTWYDENDPHFEDLKWMLARQSQGWEDLDVEAAFVGGAETASKLLSPTDVLKAKNRNFSDVEPGRFQWVLRRTVDNLYTEALRKHGLDRDLSATNDVSALRAAAHDMAEIGKTGKELQEGWRRAVELLQRALQIAREKGVPAMRAEILQEIIAAYEALRDEEAMMRALAEYARISPTRPEPWLWLGQLHLNRLALPVMAQQYFQAALERSARSQAAQLGEGDALSAIGRHAAARDAYARAGTGYDAKVRQAEALLRLGDLPGASAAAQAALSEREDARALLAHGAVLYTQGDVEKARNAFEQAATGHSDEASRLRAQACYDLGLACWRLGQADAALQAFEGCETALRYGADPARFPDETVSPSFGRALLHLAAGHQDEFLASMQEAGEEAPFVTYHAALAGMIASQAGNDAVAVRSFENALHLPGGYPELDGWIARTRLDLARQALAAGTPAEEAAADFEAAVAYAARATRRETQRDRKAYRSALRECWVRLHAANLPARRRFTNARAVADQILKLTDPEQPGALTLRGYCNFHLAALDSVEATLNDLYSEAIRDFQAVKDKVPPEDQGEWAAWRDYASRNLEAVKHWMNLEEKTVAFEGTDLPPGWETKEDRGVKVRVEQGELMFEGTARQDGSDLDPTVQAWSEDLFKLGTFEEARMLVRIPTRDARGVSKNIVSFGIEVQRQGGRTRGTGGRPVGIGLYYDRGKVAVRIGGGRDETYKTGEPRRLVPETAWPSDQWVEIRIVREDEDEGRIALYLDPKPDDGIAPDSPTVEDIVGSFKGSGRSSARLLLTGWSTQAQDFDVQVKDIRVIRRRQ